MNRERNHRTTRRRLLTVLGLTGAATVVTQVPAREAAAADGDPLILGSRDNVAADITVLQADVDTTSLVVRNEHPSFGFTIMGESANGVGVYGYSHGDQAGIAGYSAAGPAAYFATETGDAIHANGVVRVAGRREGFILEANNEADDSQGSILARTQGRGAAVRGSAQGAGIGVWGSSTTGDGLQADSESGHGIWASSRSGTAAHFESEAGTALRVNGTAEFATAGSAVIPSGQSSLVVHDARVTTASHVSITLTSDPGNRQIAWVEPHPGSGFTVHMTPVPVRWRPRTSFTYLIVETTAS